MSYRPKTPDGLKPKDLVGIPWRLAFALQEAGWYLRSDIIWEKPNCMPESVKDRPTRSHEYVFLFSKSLKYYYDCEYLRGQNGRNSRTIWSIPTEPFSGAHFATFPPKLIEPCIITGSAIGDWVLDPFFGSGTVGVVCEQQRRNYVGIELNPNYVNLSVDRIKNTQRLLFPYDVEVAQ
jgi:site-specific DNA-methyltransferase (adenine-specific)